MCARKKRSMHDNERKHAAAYSQEKESKCKEVVKHVREGKPENRKAHVRWGPKCT